MDTFLSLPQGGAGGSIMKLPAFSGTWPGSRRSLPKQRQPQGPRDMLGPWGSQTRKWYGESRTGFWRR